MKRCRHCDAPTVRGTVLCEAHYRDALDAARVEAAGRSGGRPIPRTKPPAAPRRGGRELVPREVRAARLARAVHASPEGLTREQAAEAAGVKMSALTRIIQYATEQGWIVGRPGGAGGGYGRGPAAPPSEGSAS